MDNKPEDKPASAAPRPAISETASLPRRPRGFRRRYLIAGIVALLVVAAGWIYYTIFIGPYESTDDAFVEGYVPYISPRVSGPVVRLLVKDNQAVKAGDLLIEIDPADFETQLAKARADLAAANSDVEEAKAKIIVDQAKAEQQQAAVAAAEAIAARAQADRLRYEAVQSRAISKSQLDLAQTQASSTSADVEVAQNQAKAAAAQVELDRSSVVTAEARVKQAEAALHDAELQLSYTRIEAPRDGIVTRRTVELGAYVQTGQALLALVPDDIWVTANFKETQLTYMRPGQPVRIRVDAYPGLELTGKVDSLQAGSGARFSLLPPENAVGNYVKVVQRVPVKIVFDKPVSEAGVDIAPGMSVEPEVRVK
jgi:membrane fusion protein (multidrug efflux system)